MPSIGEGVGGADNKIMECPRGWEKTHTNLGTEKARHACSPRLSLSMYRQVQNKKIIYKVMKTEHILGQVLRKVSL